MISSCEFRTRQYRDDDHREDAIHFMYQHNICIWKLCHIIYVKIPKKLKCELHFKCVAYTFEQSRLICILHSSTNKGQKYTRGKQTVVKKTDYELSLPEISLCANKNRQRRCRREPKCNHVDCFRNAQDFLIEHCTTKLKRYSALVIKWMLPSLNKAKTDMMLVLLRMNFIAI